MINKKPFQDVIDTLKNSGKYRVFNDIVRERGNFPNAIWYSKYAIKNITYSLTITQKVTVQK